MRLWHSLGLLVAMGRQVVEDAGQVLHYLHDAMGNRVAEYDATSGTSVLLREYIWMDDMPVGVVDQDGSQYSIVYLIRTDHIGRSLFATDADGNEVWRVSPGAPPVRA